MGHDLIQRQVTTVGGDANVPQVTTVGGDADPRWCLIAA